MKLFIAKYFSVAIILIMIMTCEKLYTQNVKIYETTYGFKDMAPSIIIDENSFTGEYEVYAVNEYGFKNILPDEIIENDEYNGTWKVYRVSNYGFKEIIPSKKYLNHNNPWPH